MGIASDSRLRSRVQLLAGMEGAIAQYDAKAEKLVWLSLDVN